MRNREAKMQARVDEFVTAAQDLHSSGEASFYMSEVATQIALNDEAFMFRRRVAGAVISLFGGIQHPEPVKWFGSGAPGTLYPAAAKLEGEGRLESRWEELPEGTSPEVPRRRLYQLVEQPEVQEELAA